MGACFSIGKSPGNVLGKEKIASTFTLLEDKGDWYLLGYWKPLSKDTSYQVTFIY